MQPSPVDKPFSKDNRRSEAGFTLVEMLVAVGLGVILVAGAATVMTRAKMSDSAHQARVTADQEMAQIIAMLTKDMDYLNLAAAQPVSAAGPSLTLNLNGQSLQYTSSCVQAPASLSGFNYQQAVSFGCLASTACPQGQMPSLTITRPQPQRPQVFPKFLTSGQRGATQKSVGTMACFSQTGTTLNVQLAAFYVGLNTKVVSSLTRDLSFPIGNASGVQILGAP